MVLKYLAAFKILKRRLSGRVDNIMVFLHYRIVFAFFMSCSALITAREYFGTPIACYARKAAVQENVLNTYCFFMSTFSVVKNNSIPMIYPGVTQYVEGVDEAVHRTYYQWVPIVLFLQGVSFYIPRFFWKSWDGGLFNNILQGLDKISLDQGGKDRKFKVLLQYMKTHVNMHKNWTIWFFICELLCLGIVIMNIYATNMFLGGSFMTYGTDILSVSRLASQERDDPMDRIFPRMTQCQFRKYGPTGTLEENSALCVLPVNILNVQIYICTWFLLIGLLVFTVLWLMFRVVVILSPPLRAFLLSFRGRLAGRKAVRFLSNRCSLGDWFLLYNLGSVIDPVDFGAFIREYGKEFKNELEQPLPSAPVNVDPGLMN